mmetsp:Transcript_61107/g.144304  ORF Transcript_61107/g.144304 Transcript_61107/m.144304 type:complete len:226 (-) Transcript_61107:1050-1727(-)
MRTEHMHNCVSAASCSNSFGSFTCHCNDGYTGDGLSCVDDNECLSGSHACSSNAKCHNTLGSYQCACNVGFSGDGSTCDDVNECQYHLCHSQATYGHTGILQLQLPHTDTFNEMRPHRHDTEYLSEMSRVVFSSLTRAVPDAIWVMQSWLFQDTAFWTSERIEALLSSVPDDSMIVLDLFAEVAPLWKRTGNFFGKMFLWCVLHNYGGNNGLYGKVTRHLDTRPP